MLEPSTDSEDFRAFVYEASLPALRLAAPSLAVFYTMLGLVYLQNAGQVEHVSMSITAIAVALVMFSVWLLIRIERWASQVHTLVGIAALAVILHAENLLLTSAEPERTLFFVLIQVVFGAMVLHRTWFVALTALLLCGWTYCLLTLGGDLEWARQGGALLVAVGLSLVLHTVRWQSLLRLRSLQTLERRNRELLVESAAAVEASEDRYRALVNLSPIAVLVQQKAKVIFANPMAVSMFGGTEDDLLGRPILERVHPEDRQRILDRWVDLPQRGTIGISEIRGMAMDGGIMALEVQARVIPLGGSAAILILVRDITARKQTERLKEAFVATVSHELRTPLTSLVGGLKLVLGGAVGDVSPMASSVLEVSLRNSERLKKLIDDLLDIERLQVGQLVLDFRVVDLMECVREALRTNTAYAEGCGVALLLVEEVPGVLVNADEGRVAQILSNLLSNAAKYSGGRNVEVSVQIADEGADALVSIRDHGPGIPDAFRPHVFERFRQADAKDTRSFGGSGLGLSITKSLVERHGGKIWFETSGEGTTFSFCLPVLEIVEPVTEEAVALVTEEVRRQREVHEIPDWVDEPFEE